MNQDSVPTFQCTCGTNGIVHTASCGHSVQEFMAAPAAEFRYTRRAILKGALAGGLTLATLPLLTAEAEADIFTPSVSDQIKLGAQASKQILQKYREVKDSRSRHFARIGDKLVNALNSNDRRTWNYRFYVIESKDINAFALPGGNVFMFTGLMDKIHSDDELAAVTAHEMTHVRKQHWAKAVASRSKVELGLGVLLGATHAGKTWQNVAGLGDTFYSLHFSRREEDEADAGGLEDMIAANFDPHGMLDLFDTLQTASGGHGQAPAFLSDHPLTKDRIKKTQERIDRLNW